MTKLAWNATGTRLYEAGVDRGVLYPVSGYGVAWNGIVSVTETPTQGSPRTYFMDGVKYLAVASRPDFSANVTGFTYPREFEACLGWSYMAFGLGVSGQYQESFHFSYRTLIGSDTMGFDQGYKIHLVYNALAQPTASDFETLSEQDDPSEFTWDISTTPISVPGKAPTAHLIIDSTRSHPVLMAQIEDILYGTEETAPRIPSPAELIAIFGAFVDPDATPGLILLVEEPEFSINSTTVSEEDGVYTLDHPFVVDGEDGTYTIST